MIKLLNISFFIIVSSSLFAQQLPQYSQWFFHQNAFNPAHAGIKSYVDIHSLYRLQWIGVQGAPRTGFATFSSPLQAKRTEYLSMRHGIGAKIEFDQIGQFNTNKLNLSYAAHMNFSRDNRLSLGISAGFLQFAYDPTKTVTIYNDPKVFSEAALVLPDASLGAWWNGSNYYFGASFLNLVPVKWNGVGTDSRYRFQSYYTAGYRQKLAGGLTFLPNLMIKVPRRGILAFDVDAIFDYKNVVGFGAGYRYIDAFIAFFYFKINQQFAFHYSFDYVISPLAKTYSHEISIAISTFKPKITGPIKTELFH